MNDTEFYSELAVAERLNNETGIGRMLAYIALDRCREYAHEEGHEHLEPLLPRGWRRIPHA